MNLIHDLGMPRLTSPTPPLASLRAFEAAARLGSFKAASDQLNLTSSAVSHQIKLLEAHFRVELFKRSGRGVILTEDGEAYSAAISRAFADIARAGISLTNRRQSRIVRLSALPTFATFAAIPSLGAFAVRNPSMELRLEARNTNVNPDMELIDAAIHIGAAPFLGFGHYRIFRTRMIPFGHPKLWEKYQPISTPKDLARVPLIEFNKTLAFWNVWFDRFKMKPVEPQVVSDSLVTGLRMAESGLGVILAPMPLVVPALSSGQLVAPLKEFLVNENVDFHLIYRKADEGTQKIRALIHWTKSIAESMEAEAGRLGFKRSQNKS